jgi:hypothetical protein
MGLAGSNQGSGNQISLNVSVGKAGLRPGSQDAAVNFDVGDFQRSGLKEIIKNQGFRRIPVSELGQ